MDRTLHTLILAFQSTTARTLSAFLNHAQLSHPFDWRASGMARAGVLEGAPPIEYQFHGAGLRLRVGDEAVDFDFGFDGRTGGFNEWWLAEFAAQRPAFREFVDRERLQAALAAARSAGEIIRPFRARHDDLDYLASDITVAAS